MADYLLTPPTVEESFTQYDRVTDPLWRWYHIDTARSIVKVDGTWSVARMSSYPGEEDLDASYQGGRVYTVDQATADEMIADGLGDYLTAILGTYSEEVLADSPEVYYRLNESGVTAIDSSGNGRDGTLVPNSVAGLTSDGDLATSSLGMAPGEVVFGIGEVAPFLSDLTEWSIEIWLNGEGTVSIAAQSGDIGCVAGLLTELPVAGDLTFICRTVEAPGVNVYATLADSEWDDGEAHHLVGTFDGSTMRLYVDGTEVATEPLTGTLTVNVFAGQQALTGLTVYDEAAFYSTALSAERVQAHYEAGVA